MKAALYWAENLSIKDTHVDVSKQIFMKIENAVASVTVAMIEVVEEINKRDHIPIEKLVALYMILMVKVICEGLSSTCDNMSE